MQYWKWVGTALEEKEAVKIENCSDAGQDLCINEIVLLTFFHI